MLTKKPKRAKLKFQLSLVVLALSLLGLPLITHVQAADGANGKIQASAQIFHISGAAISISMWDLDVSSDYHINWTGESTGVTFTTSASQTTFSHTFVLTTSTATIIFYLRAGAAGTILDQTQVTVANIADFLATGLIISAGIFVLIVVIFKKIVK